MRLTRCVPFGKVMKGTDSSEKWSSKVRVLLQGTFCSSIVSAFLASNPASFSYMLRYVFSGPRR